MYVTPKYFYSDWLKSNGSKQWNFKHMAYMQGEIFYAKNPNHLKPSK